jgi:hypothetical protein
VLIELAMAKSPEIGINRATLPSRTAKSQNVTPFDPVRLPVIEITSSGVTVVGREATLIVRASAATSGPKRMIIETESVSWYYRSRSLQDTAMPASPSYSEASRADKAFAFAYE